MRYATDAGRKFRLTPSLVRRRRRTTHLPGPRFDESMKAYQVNGYDGIGLCRTGDLVFIDLDGCRNPDTGALTSEPWVSQILAAIEGQAYLKVSVTGTGLHAVCHGRVPEGRRQWDEPAREHTGFAFYDRNRYFTFTGNALPTSGTISPRTLDDRRCPLSVDDPPRFIGVFRRSTPSIGIWSVNIPRPGSVFASTRPASLDKWMTAGIGTGVRRIVETPDVRSSFIVAVQEQNTAKMFSVLHPRGD